MLPRWKSNPFLIRALITIESSKGEPVSASTTTSLTTCVCDVYVFVKNTSKL